MQKSGLARSYAEMPVDRVQGPINKLFDLRGDIIQPTSRLHPLGPLPGRKVVGWKDGYGDVDM